jgi:hypothetical protein
MDEKEDKALMKPMKIPAGATSYMELFGLVVLHRQGAGI